MDASDVERSTERLTLRPLSLDESMAVVAGDRAGRSWAADYPTEGDILVAGLIVAAGADAVPPWCSYSVVVRASALTVGGAGFKGAPRNGAVEIGYGLAPSAQGRGLATEAVQALLEVAQSDLGVVVVEAEADPGNGASHRVLIRSGFEPAGHREGLMLFRRPTRAR